MFYLALLKNLSRANLRSLNVWLDFFFPGAKTPSDSLVESNESNVSVKIHLNKEFCVYVRHLHCAWVSAE